MPSRLIAKKYLFRTIYNRGKGYAFTVDPEFMHVSTSVKYWDGVGEQFYKKYNNIDHLHLKWGEQVARGIPLEGIFGRFWPIEKKRNWRGELEIPWTVLTNLPVQGTGHDLMTIARVSFFNRLKKLNLIDKVKVVSTVHDSIVVDSPSIYIQTLVNLFYEVFDDLQMNIKKLFHYEWIVPLTCEVKAGMNMRDMEKIERS